MARKILTVGFLILFQTNPCSARPQQFLKPGAEDGIRAMNAGDFVSAEKIFSELQKSAPSAENVGYLAMAEAGAGNLAQAIPHFQQSIRMGNDGAAAHYNLGIAYLNARRDQEGIQELRSAIAKDPDFPPSQRALGGALLNAGRPREAIPSLEQARQQLPRDPGVRVDLVRAQFAVHNGRAAIANADEAMQAIPGNARMNQELADLCLQNNQLQKARSILEDAHELTPNDSNIALSLARVSLQAGEPIEAVAALKNVPSEAGLPGEPMFLRGEARILTKDYVIAEVDLSAAMQADSQNPRYLAAYARLQQLQGLYREALDTLQRAGEVKAQGPEIPFRRAVSYYYLSFWQQAAESCQEAIGRQSDFVVAYLLLGAARFRLHDLPGTEEAFSRAVALKPRVAYFHIARALAQFNDGSIGASLNDLDQALLLNPQAANAYFYRARVFSRQGERRKAIEDLETAVAIQPHYRQAYAELARLYTADGQREKAKAAFASEAAELQVDENENQRMQREIRDSTDEIGDVLKLSDILNSR